MIGKPLRAEDVFNPKDFESIRLIVTFENITTRMTVQNINKCSVQELGDKTLVLEVPRKSCNVKHNVLVQILREDKKQKKHKPIFDTTGKIISVEELDDSLRVTVECLQYEESQWNDLFNLFLTRQEEITNFLNLAKG